MFRIAICDDEQDVCGYVESIIIFCTQHMRIKPDIEVFHSGETLLEFISNGNIYDLIFLDIEMDSLNGIEFGKLIRHRFTEEEVRIVYISWKQSYAMELFKIRPYDFLIKPIQDRSGEIASIVLKTLEDVKKNSKFYKFNIGKKYCKEHIIDITYFESSNRVIILKKKDEQYRFYGKLDLVEEEVDSAIFLRIHKSLLINIKHVLRFEGNSVFLDNGEVLGISKTYKKHVNEFNMRNWGILDE